MTSKIDSHTGGVDGVWSYTIEREVDAYADAMKDLAHLLGKQTAVERMTRAFYGDVVVRTEAVEGISIPPIATAYEDEFIRRYIVAQGFKWKRCQEVVCLHHRKLNVGQAWDCGYYGYKFGMISPRQAIQNLLTIVPKSAFAVARTKMWRIIPMQLNREIRTSAGCLAAWLRSEKKC